MDHFNAFHAKASTDMRLLYSNKDYFFSPLPVGFLNSGIYLAVNFNQELVLARYLMSFISSFVSVGTERCDFIL